MYIIRERSVKGGKSKMFGYSYSFMNGACLLRRVAKGASARDFVMCYLSAGEFYTWPLDAAVKFPLHGGPLVFLGYSRRRDTL